MSPENYAEAPRAIRAFREGVYGVYDRCTARCVQDKKKFTMIRFSSHRVLWTLVLVSIIGTQRLVMAELSASPPSALPASAPLKPSSKAAATRTIGEKKLLFIRVDFEDKPGAPISEAQARKIMEEVDAFYAANSQGKTRIITEVTPVLRLPRLAAWYEKTNSKTTPISQIVPKDARLVARAAGYDLDVYQWEIVNCRTLVARGGAGTIAGKGLILNGVIGFGVTAHELGHNYGLDHASLWQTTDGSVIGSGQEKGYGNGFDLMGAHNGAQSPLRHFSAHTKNFLNWLPDEAVQTVVSSGTYRIFAHDLPDAAGLRALKIKDDNERNYWVEFRQLQTQNRYLMNGALLYWEFNKKQRKTTLLDMTPGSPEGAKDAPLLIGRTFSDTEAGIHITPVGKGKTTPESLDIVVNIGSFQDNKAPTVHLKARSLFVSPGERITFNTNASDADGDQLAYSWQSSDGDIGGNISVITRSWSTRGTYEVRCTVTDMKGGIAEDRATVVVQ